MRRAGPRNICFLPATSSEGAWACLQVRFPANSAPAIDPDPDVRARHLALTMMGAYEYAAQDGFTPGWDRGDEEDD